MRRSISALAATAALAAPAAISTSPAVAADVGRCDLAGQVDFTPALSMHATTGTFRMAEPGTAGCTGVIDSWLVDGSGTWTMQGIYSATSCMVTAQNAALEIDVPRAIQLFEPEYIHVRGGLDWSGPMGALTAIGSVTGTQAVSGLAGGGLLGDPSGGSCLAGNGISSAPMRLSLAVDPLGDGRGEPSSDQDVPREGAAQDQTRASSTRAAHPAVKRAHRSARGRAHRKHKRHAHRRSAHH
jgi:hypothetical protein